ncbi:putative protein phosphatase 2A regulatory subunit [Leptomonas pyrrhocoris]|uniref:Protein phosphatase 2A regulatory subunit n=1 Tax=Leptomonas pyrrhocoris TaxID=157538 RepID=A0A0M9FSF4_LEPPY|nr:putative protein phosphatase 2A regulatory subunit [Leptomonas pyrrhocoris]KPA75115.1 putative protein phosphatase 2A regulatory subunit [Leptomonas pyrrhocoris]|eukprot:XP_015653554.1 putative protein phosphatase 2A regulatory subunit [Leptomonas pyrrhocoris]
MSSTNASSSSPVQTGAVDSMPASATGLPAVAAYQCEGEAVNSAAHVDPTNNRKGTMGNGSSAGGGAGTSTIAPAQVNPFNASLNASLAGLNASFGAGSMSMSQSTTSVSPTNASGLTPYRSLNAAFTIGPRPDSDVEASEEYNSDAPSVCLELDRHDPPIKRYCNLGSLEERRTFVTEGCVTAAKSMSTQRIIEHLLPAILTAFEADDYGESFDNCAPSIAQALPQVITCMEHKNTANITYFMGLIMELCCSAEQVVVKETIASLQQILAMVEDEVVLDLFLPFVLTMRVSFWSAPRTVAASLLGHIAMRPAVLQASGLTVTDMFNYYAECSSDASTMVRVGVVTSLHDWVRVASVHRLTLAEMPLPLLRTLATDDLSDTVRYLLIEEIVKLARLIGRKSTSKYLLSTYVSAFVDPSWRVRFMAANHLGTMAALVVNADDLEIVLKTLAADEEPETRAAVARQLDTVVVHCSSAMIQHCCALVVEHFAEDENPVVRRSAARHCHCFIYGSDEVVLTMCNFLAKLMEDASFVVQESAIESLGDLVTSLGKSVRAAEQQAALSDSMNSSGTTNLNINSNNGGGNAAHGAGTGPSSSTSSRSSTSKPQPQPPQFAQPPIHSRSGRHHSPHHSSRLVTAMAAANGSANTAESNVAFVRKRADSIARAFVDKLSLLSGSRNWRIRDVVVRVTQYFPKVLPPDQFRPLTSIVVGALHDPVSAVRRQAVHTLKKVAAAYGGAWAAQTAMELLHSDTLSPARAVGYMWRVVMIQCLEVLLPVVRELDATDPVRRQLLPMTAALLQQYTTDRVPNVRIAAALALPKWFAWFDVTEVERTAYNEAIHTLQQDTDVDVLDASQHIPYNRRIAEEEG